MQKLIAGVIAIACIAAILWIFIVYGGKGAPQAPAAPAQPIATAHYQCDAGKTIDASYFQGESKPATAPDQPPTPGGSVHITLSDGRDLTLPQTVSASGIRYANADESVVFWSKGKGAFLMENNQQTYQGCIEVAPDPGGLSKAFESGSEGFSVRYPAGYAVDTNYRYQALGPGKDIGGIKFTVSPSIATGTNLSDDSYFSVEEIPQTQNCTASLFLDGGDISLATTTIGDTTYSVASSTGAAAGNRYEETVYAIPGTNPCIAVRYFIHYGVIENYPPGTVQPFDEGALREQFDAMRDTLTISQ